MKTKNMRNRKCSAILAAGAGAAVCLTSAGTAHAAIVTGNISASNGGTSFSGTTVFGSNGKSYLKAFGDQVSWRLRTDSPGARFSWMKNFPQINGVSAATVNGCLLAGHNADLTVSAGMANGFGQNRKIPASVSNKYMAVRFRDTNLDYYHGWMHIVTGSNNTISFDKWGYQGTIEGSIKTLSDSVTTRKLALSDGQTKLHWANENEDGVARYEVQAKDAAGQWQAVDSNTPGDGAYAAKVDSDAECRLVVERVDGDTEEFAF